VQALAEVPTLQQGISHGNRTDCVVGVAALIGEQLKIIVVGRVEFKPATYNVANYCS
jgi:hypothetical protein